MMHAFESLAGVQEFLLARVLPASDPSFASEVRAAAKILANVALELRTLRPRLEAEFDELAQLCTQAETVLPAAATAPATKPAGALPQDLLECLTLRRTFEAHVARTLVQLQILAETTSPDASTARTHALAMYAALQRHAGERLRWQSVFPTPTQE